jgi:hypothetical protein
MKVHLKAKVFNYFTEKIVSNKTEKISSFLYPIMISLNLRN